jgi:hypothetical protein
MDMIVNKWDSKLFDWGEIDLLCDAIDSLLFKEFFENENTLLSIHCVQYDSDDMDRVIYCRNKLDVEVRTLSYKVCGDIFEEFYKENYDYPIPQLCARSVKIENTDMYFYTTALKLSLGYVYFFVAIDDPNLTEAAVECTYGLTLTICKMLSPDDDGAAKLSNSLPHSKYLEMNSTVRAAINKRVEELFESDRKSVVAWREDHL